MIVRPGVVAAAVAVLLLAGCAGPTRDTSKVTVTGDVGELPVVAFDEPLAVTRTVTQEVWTGEGITLGDGDPVLVNYLAEDAANGNLVGETYSTGPLAKTLSPESLGTGLYGAIKGRTVGSRLLFLSPAESADDAALVIVIDLLPTRALGDAVEARRELPAVTRAVDGKPTIQVPTSPPPADIVVQPLIKGPGPQVAAGQTIVVQYTGVNWSDGSLLDTTWADGKGPFTTEIGVGRVIAGWDQGLVEQTVGSQVLLVIPPELGYGDETLVFVVDILAAAGKPVDTLSLTPSAAPSATGTSSPSTGVTPSVSPTDATG